MSGIQPSAVISDEPYDPILWDDDVSNGASKNVLRDLIQSGAIVSLIANIGSGSEVYKGNNAGTHEFRRIFGSGGVVITQHANDIEVYASPNPQVTAVSQTLQAGQSISAIRAIVGPATAAIYATQDGTYEEANAVGISVTSALITNSFEIVTHGLVEDTSFSSFVVNKEVYLGVNGVLTQTAPLTGFLTTLGKYMGGNKIIVTIKDPVQRS